MGLNDHAVPAEAPQSAAQLRYAALLDWGTRIGFLTLAATFTVYVLGWLPLHVPLEQLPGLWDQPVARYLELTRTPEGWGWLTLAHHGDLANLIGIAFIAACSLPPLLGLIPLYLKQRDPVFATLCALEVAVIVLAASGILTTGH